jgi:hypothetical protein
MRKKPESPSLGFKSSSPKNYLKSPSAKIMKRLISSFQAQI